MSESEDELTLEKIGGYDPRFSPFNLIGPPLPMETWWHGPGWKMHWAKMRLNFHLAWHRLKHDSVKWRIFGRWFVYPQHFNPGGYHHETVWLVDGLERICSVRCICGKTFGQKRPILPLAGSDEFHKLVRQYKGEK